MAFRRRAPVNSQKQVSLRSRAVAAHRAITSFCRGLRFAGTRMSPTLCMGLAAFFAIHNVGQSPKTGGESQSSKPAGQVQEGKTAPRRADSVAEPGATSKSPLALPFKRSWEYLTSRMILIAPTVDGDRIYQPLQEGRVVCLDRQSGSLLWSIDSGGLISAPIAPARSDRGNVIFVVSEKLAQDGGSSGLVRALDPATGVALWAHDYPRPFTSSIALGRGRIYLGSADGSLYAVSTTDGAIAWKVPTQGVVNAGALVTDKAIYFGSDDGALRALNPVNGQELWKYQTTGRIICLPATDDKHIYFGSADGCVYSLDPLDGRLKWKSRTGAAVDASPVIAGDRLIVGSLDNFIYAISLSTGDRLWKRRLDNRIVFPVIVEGDAVMVAPLRGDHVPIFLMSDGRRVSYYSLTRGSEIVASPSFTDGFLLVPTDKGLIAAVPVNPPKSEEASKSTRERSPTTPTTAEQIKKPNPRPPLPN